MIEPFRGWWYAKRAAVAPVRDALSEELKIQLYEDPYQALHIALPREAHQASTYWHEWISAHVIVQEPLPAFYAYSQTFHTVGGERGPFIRVGVIGILPIAVPVLPHERTLKEREGGIAEVLRLLPVQATPVHLLAEAEWEAVHPILREALVCPRLSVAGWDGVMHRLSPIQHKGLLERLRAAFRQARFYIADGHHRWRAVQQAGLSHLLVLLTDKGDPSLQVPSAHRLLWNVEGILERCKPYFDMREAGARVPLWQEVMGLRNTIGLVTPKGHAWTLRLLPKYWTLLEKRPLISWLHEWVIDPSVQEGAKLEFGREWRTLMRSVREKNAWLFVMPPLPVKEVFQAADKGQPLPAKATYFFPKVLSGLVFYQEQNPPQSQR